MRKNQGEKADNNGVSFIGNIKIRTVEQRSRGAEEQSSKVAK